MRFFSAFMCYICNKKSFNHEKKPFGMRENISENKERIVC